MNHQQNEISRPKELYVVGLGASAGGLDAISKFLSNYNGVSADFCVVIVMHLSPDYKSELTSILSKRCKWPVETVSNNLTMEPRTIYITPQNCDLHVEGDTLVLDSLPEGYSHAPSIDNFFTSLALAKKNKSLGVILSGFGKDGTKGIQKIKENFGFTIAQLPETAEHRDMPTAAIDSGKIDMVIPAEQMYDEIVQYINNSHTVASSQPAQKSVDAIFDLLEKRSGTDFSLYKPSTIMRRINHRMNTLQLKSLIDYYDMIKGNPKELDVLFETVLIGVTEFFRDTKAFESLRSHLKDMLNAKKAGDSIRMWCVGCATGEEPYSIAILLHELLGASINQYHIQIFASDIDERALNYARKGIYSKESLKNLDDRLIDSYFTVKGTTHYELNKEIKQHTLFTRHDISNDPPFVKLDLVVCRNLLIYFNNELQKQSLQIFHYALRPKGLLFLGKSESISQVSDLFQKSDSNKIFTKAEASLNYELRFSRFKSQNYLKNRDENNAQKVRNISLVDAAKETLYYKYQHPFVIINDNAEIKQVHGSLRLYLEISQGTMNANLYKMVNPELVTVLKGLHAQVRKTGVHHVSHVVKFNLYGNDHFVRINLTPIIYEIQDANFYIVIFEKVEPSEQVLELQKKLNTADFVDLRIKELEDELATNKEHLQIFTEELEATNEELQTINEELQSANEELKSSNEELETSNEELQSANEELNTANYELRVTNEAYLAKEQELKEEKEVSELNEQIYRTIAENIPNGAVGILNTDFEIEYIAGKGLGNSTPEDLIGRSMPDMNPLESERKKLKDICKSAISGQQASVEVHYDGRYYDVYVVPFKLSESTPSKIMYLTQEITKIKNNKLLLDTALQASNLIVFNYDYRKGEYIPNKALSEFLEVSEDLILTEKVLEELIHPEDRAIRKKSLKKAKKSGEIKHEIRFLVSSGVKHARITGKLEVDDDNKPLQSFAIVLDTTEDKYLLQRVKESEERFRNIADAVPMAIWQTDLDMNFIYFNRFWLDFTGTTLQDNLDRGFIQFIHPEDRDHAIANFKNAFAAGVPFSQDYRVLRKDGVYRWFTNQGVPVADHYDLFMGYIGSIFDITAKKEFTEELERSVAIRTKELEEANSQLVKANINLEEYAYVASHDLQEPLRKIRMFNSVLFENKDDSESVEQYCIKIESLAQRMTDLIKGIFVYGELSKSSNKWTRVDLDQILATLIDDLEELIESKSVMINAENLGHISGNAVHIHQLFSNLVRNAIKFSKNNPIIKIHSERISGAYLNDSFKADPAESYLKLSFEDNGIGIEHKFFDSIFKPFKRLNSKSDFPGTGIGLAICKRIVDMHNGYIELRSIVGEGSIFIIYFPIKKDN